MKEMLDRANKENYGVAAPNVSMELDVRAVLEAAEELNAPLILDVAFFATPDIVFAGSYITRLAEQSKVPVAINLDHGKEFFHAIAAIRAGFTSIMVDRSMLPFEENIAQVAELVKVAHAVGVSVEAELGHVGSGMDESDAGIYTEPDKALDYIQRTGIDCLAVAIGTAHGAYKQAPKLDFDRLAQIKELTKFPLVLHGGSGSGDEQLAKACKMGINKINVANDLMRASYNAIKNANMDGNAVYGLFRVAKDGFKGRMKELIECFGGKDKAWSVAPKGVGKVVTFNKEA